MNWKQCIKDLRGFKVVTSTGHFGVIESFDITCANDGFIGKYKVKVSNYDDRCPFRSYWYTWAELTVLEQL